MSVFQGQASERVVYLVNAGLPVTGLVDTDVLLRYRKKGEVFQNKTLTPDNFKELEVGLYSVEFDATEVDTLGPLTYRINGAGIDQHIETFDVDPVYLGVLTPPDVCNVYGNLIDLGATPVWNSPVSFRIVGLPAVVATSMVVGTIIRTNTDAHGNFSALLIRGATVIVEIESAALKFQFVVPDQESVDLSSLIPFPAPT